MRLRRLEIENFRGVRSLDWRHIAETSALVGPGDSGKSTILEAIERVLSPKWNVAFDDTDFWDLGTDVAIAIRATLTDLAPSFYRDTKFGLHLHAFDKDKGEAVRADGSDGEQHALEVRDVRVPLAGREDARERLAELARPDHPLSNAMFAFALPGADERDRLLASVRPLPPDQAFFGDADRYYVNSLAYLPFLARAGKYVKPAQ